MTSKLLLSCSLMGLLAAAPRLTAAQTPTLPALADTTHKYENPSGEAAPSRRPFFKSKGFRAAIVPAVLIGYGASTINGHGLYSSYDANKDIRRVFGTYRSHLDDYLQWAPYLEVGAVLLAGVESHDDRLNLGLIILKSEAIMLSSVYVVKSLAGVQRPDGSDNLSFPSGHTAQAFLAASIVHTEFRDKSQWYGIGAYTLATSVAALRMINNKHWQSDVVAGAGFGILSAHLAYLSHRNRWGRKSIGRDVGLVPTWSPGSGAGVLLSWRPSKSNSLAHQAH
ncbi:phosphatase PAP2 family protein [Hymenobacter sp. BT664]|uniref:Phosphatase PAP2 family protein n=1 Tax=Hymenobacter montanus TaxID=2771359 RepID=A0A927GJ47_9BACT|nr:phosphatase PAP2 family protein [Hymenobacter montanus]MBD2768113.1 phosphatase PAP2 family protein [Hymenobacter montanus]